MYLIVVPCFNEAKRWSQGYWDELLKTPHTKWLFVDDGSTDDTARILKALGTRPNAECLLLPHNCGKAEAVRAGMISALLSKQSWCGIGFIDADGAFEPREINDVISRCEEVLGRNKKDALWTSRVSLAGRQIERSIIRHYIGRVLATIFSFRTSPIPYDTQCGFKVFAASPVLQEVLQTRFRTRWLFELEMLNTWKQVCGKQMLIWEEPLNFWKEIGKSKISLREAVRIFYEIIKIKIIQLEHKKS